CSVCAQMTKGQRASTNGEVFGRTFLTLVRMCLTWGSLLDGPQNQMLQDIANRPKVVSAMDLKTRWNECDIYLHQGDLTALDVDALVNAANPWLRGGGGVDGAIHRRGGPRILADCQKIIAERGRVLATGEAVITTGGNLTARYVI